MMANKIKKLYIISHCENTNQTIINFYYTYNDNRMRKQKPTNKKTYRKRDFWFPEIRAGGIGQRQLKGANFQL